MSKASVAPIELFVMQYPTEDDIEPSPKREPLQVRIKARSVEVYSYQAEKKASDWQTVYVEDCR